MGTPRTSTGGTQSGTTSSQASVNNQQLIEILQSFVQQDIANKIDAMKPEIQTHINSLVDEAKNNVVNEIEKSRTELQSVRNSVLSAVAVFAAFFTFVSVNINIFSKTNALESLALMIVMWICLMGFTYSFFLFLADKWNNWKYWIPIIVGMILTGIVLYEVKDITLQDLKNKSIVVEDKNISK